MAISNRELRTNPCFEVKKYRGEVRRKRYLLPEEETQLMEALTGRRSYLRLIVMTALHTGMRRGEILRLRKQDIDFHRGEIRVTKTKKYEDREIPINGTLMHELMNHCVSLDSKYLFKSPKTGRPITEIKKGFVKACEIAGIEDFWFHDLRHTASTRMGEAGVDPFTIAAIMGHSDIKMTASYTHATIMAKRQAVTALEQGLRESEPQTRTAASADRCK
jgi:integrase